MLKGKVQVSLSNLLALKNETDALIGGDEPHITQPGAELGRVVLWTDPAVGHAQSKCFAPTNFFNPHPSAPFTNKDA